MPAPVEHMAAMTPRQVAEAMYAAMLSSDFETLLAITAPKIRIRVTETLPYGGEYFGLAGFQAFFKATFELIESKIEVERLFEAGERVVVVGRTRGTGRATGQYFDAAIVHMLTVERGRVVSFDAHVEDGPINAAIHGTSREA